MNLKFIIRNSLLGLLVCLPVVARAQWTAKDSLNLQRILGGKEELKLNMEAVKQIDFSTPLGAPRASKSKPGLRVDETLPLVNQKKKIVLTLQPYNSRTKYNWDPIYQRKIDLDKPTWRDNLGRMMADFYNSSSTPIKIGKKGVTLDGGTIGGLDLMTLFTKDFWDKKGRERRERTLDVLKSYGDSTTILFSHPVLQSISK